MPATRFVYHPAYDFNRWLPLAKRVHGFVLDKPSRIRRFLIRSGAVKADGFEQPARVLASELAAIHDEQVIAGLRSSRSIARAAELAPLALLPSFLARRIVVEPQLRACGGTSLALKHAAAGDWVFNLSGGFHHARPDLSHGFCLVNDVGWAVHQLERPARVLVLDLDLHQGDGNAEAFRGVEGVFTASLHQEDAFPFPKVESDLDLGLRATGVGDQRYLDAVDELLAGIAARFEPTVVIYVAGTDPFVDDAIGGFDVTAAGLLERDRRVARFTRERGAGLVALPAGGYSSRSPELSGAGFAAMAELFAGR